jgi:hypothetical protein
MGCDQTAMFTNCHVCSISHSYFGKILAIRTILVIIGWFIPLLSINRPTKRKEKSPSDGLCKWQKEMGDNVLACQQILEKEPRSDTPC